ncbi:MAG TPA: hypothetical protein VLX61_17665 [Anaerolineales bacterium]|nr:hypothetical protein [Anaerolineales bacterium]
MSKIKNIVINWLPFAVVVTAFCALTYAAVQQALRQGLNDPQIQMAEDTAYALNHGATFDSIVAGSQVEMSHSLAPFIDTYDTNGNVIAGDGLLNGQLPDYPQGALDRARQNGENRVTWQPQPDVRIASVVVPYDTGFVVAGRNMREVEQREDQTELLAGATWLLALIATFSVIAFGEFVLVQK